MRETELRMGETEAASSQDRGQRGQSRMVNILEQEGLSWTAK